jgi:YD repeat-containing protein
MAVGLLLLAGTPANAQEGDMPRMILNEPTDPEIISATAWTGAKGHLNGAVGSVDVRYRRSEVPREAGATMWSASAWRGERVHAQVVLWTAPGVKRVSVVASDLAGDQGGIIPAEKVRPFFVRYVLGDGKLWADPLDPAREIDIAPWSTRPVWISVDVPSDAAPGVYRGRIAVRSGGEQLLEFGVVISVLTAVLPPPAKWGFYLDLWQNPWAVARYHGVKIWSDGFWVVAGPHLRLLAEAGQKCLTTTVVHQAWGTQTWDPYGSMVEWTRKKGGKWEFDYAVFDRYVEFAEGCGYTDWINCYSLVPWRGIRFNDEWTGKYDTVGINLDSPEYRAAAGAFLKDFSSHLKRKGWFNRTRIAMDERPPEMILKVLALIAEFAPGMKVALAGGDHPELYDSVDDMCFFISHRIKPVVIDRRNRRRQPTTFYVCCGPVRPNTFTFSPPAESAWLPWFAAARGYGGFLRWAHDSWTADPLHDTTHTPKEWPAGDCFLVYPGPRSSIRFERLREGIQDFEKIRIIRERLGRFRDGKRLLKRLDSALARFDYPACGNDSGLAENLAAGKRVLEELTHEMK